MHLPDAPVFRFDGTVADRVHVGIHATLMLGVLIVYAIMLSVVAAVVWCLRANEKCQP